MKNVVSRAEWWRKEGGLRFVGTPPTLHLLMPVLPFPQPKKKNEKQVGYFISKKFNIMQDVDLLNPP